MHDQSREKTAHEVEKDLAWEKVSRTQIIKNRWIDFRSLEYRFPDGNTFGPYYSYNCRNYAVIVASDEEGRFLCVRQFRQGVEEVTTEFPAGGIERKDVDNREDVYGDKAREVALAAAKRELAEETGYVSDEWTHLLTIPSHATISGDYGYLFRAKNCRKTSGQSLDDTEFLNVITYSADEIEALIESGKFQQAVHALAWFLAQREQ